jgi:hypothetical protein
MVSINKDDPEVHTMKSLRSMLGASKGTVAIVIKKFQ